MEIINHKGKYYLKTETGYREIVASTDSSLYIKQKTKTNKDSYIYFSFPQPSQDFIKVFVEEYNRGNVIEWVEVEYEEIQVYEQTKNEGFGSYFGKKESEYKLKVNSKNEITIRKSRDTLKTLMEKDPELKKEVIKLCQKAWLKIPNTSNMLEEFNKWIEQNL